MQIDWRLMRAILDAIEKMPAAQRDLRADSFSEWDLQTVSIHMRLLEQRGLIEATVFSGPTLVVAVAHGLTLEGVDLNSKLRNPHVWEWIPVEARKVGADLTVEVVKSLASKLMDRLLNAGQL